MATRTVRAPAVFSPTELERRQMCGLNATWEIAQIAQQLLERAASNDETEEFLRRGQAIRLRDLNSVCMSIQGGDDLRETADMEMVVFGGRCGAP